MTRSARTVLVLVAAALALFVGMPLLWRVLGGWQDGGWGMMGPGIGWMWFMPLLGVVFLALVVWAVVALVQGFSQPGAAGGALGQQDSALEILKRRYARGEISKEEYEEKRRDLG